MVKQVLIWRDDLRTVDGKKIPKGKIASQMAHASVLAVRSMAVEKDGYQVIDLAKYPDYKAWDEGDYKKISLKVSSLYELLQLEKMAKEKGLIARLVVDNGYTCFDGEKTITCLAIGPNKSVEIDKLTKHLKVL